MLARGGDGPNESNTAVMDIEQLDGFDDDVGLGQEDKKYARNNQLEWFKGEKGKTYRVAFVYFNPLEASLLKALRKQNPQATKDELIDGIKKGLAKRAEQLGKSVDALAEYEKLDTSNVRFKRIEANYKEGVGYVVSRYGKDGPEADQIWKTLGDVKTYFTTALLFYPCNSEGEINKEALKAGEWTIKPWRFSNKVYGALHQRAAGLRENGLSIASQDVKLTCTNGEFQNFDIDIAGPAVWLKNDQFKASVLSKAESLYAKLVPFRELSTADLKIKLGLGGGGSSSEGVGDDDFAKLLDEV